MILLFEGINPEPWRSPKLGTKRIGRKVVPVAFKDENLRGYQMAITETATEFLTALDIALPVFRKDAELRLDVAFWRQTESYEGEGRRNTRNRADVTNMQKAIEDALQGVLYANDRHNVVVRSTLVDVGPLVTPRILVDCQEEDDEFRWLIAQGLSKLKETARSDGSGMWVKG